MDGPPSGQSCVPMCPELVDNDEDADENADADQTRTGRPVSGQSFTQFEEADINFRIPRLSHAVSQYGTKLQKKTTHIVSFQRKRRYQRQWYLTLNKSSKKWAYQTWIRFASCCLNESLHHESSEQIEELIFSRTTQYMASLFKHIVVEQELELSSKNFFIYVNSFLSQLVSFTIDGDPL